MDTEKFKEKANLKHKNFYNYDKSIFITRDDPLIITCNIHGDFLQKPKIHLYGRSVGSGCKKCWLNRNDDIINEFKEKSFNKFGEDLFDLSRIQKVKNKFMFLICKKHNGFFSTSLEDHLNSDFGNCIRCKKDNKIKTHSTIIKKIKKKSNKNYYNLKQIEYICNIHKYNCNIKYKINYLEDCYFCKQNFNDTKTIEFVKKAINIHKYKYNYSKSLFIHCVKNKICITCPKHGDFYQTPNCHLQGKGCKKCATIISNKETKWLDSLNISLKK